MTIKLSILLSFICVVLTISSMFDGNLQEVDSTAPVSEHFVEPQLLPEKLLTVEQDWFAQVLNKSKEAEQAEEAPQVIAEPKQALLNFGGIEFALLGIFKNNNNGFILLRDDSNQVLKISEGDVITDNVVLMAITTDSITVQVSEEERNIRLFKRVNEDSNG